MGVLDYTKILYCRLIKIASDKRDPFFSYLKTDQDTRIDNEFLFLCVKINSFIKFNQKIQVFLAVVLTAQVFIRSQNLVKGFLQAVTSI